MHKMIRRVICIFFSTLLLVAFCPVSTAGDLAPSVPLSGDSLQENSSSTNNNGTHSFQLNNSLKVPQPPIPTSPISHRRSQRDFLGDVSVFYYFSISNTIICCIYLKVNIMNGSVFPLPKIFHVVFNISRKNLD